MADRRKPITPRYKIVFIGNAGAGKTSIIHSFIQGRADPNQVPTVGIDFLSKLVYIGDTLTRLQFWDTAGQQRFASLTPSYIKDATIACVVYDVTNISSFEAVSKWADQVRKMRGQRSKIVLIGNKVDLQHDRLVSTSDGYQKSRELGAIFMEVSAKRSLHIQELFTKIVSMLQATAQANKGNSGSEQEDSSHGRGIKLAPNTGLKRQNAKQSKRCC